MNSIISSINSAWTFLTTSPYGIIILIVLALLFVLLVIVPLFMKLRRKRLKKKETGEIMKDLFTWRHLSQLVKGGDEHNKAKQELSDNIARINELLRQGFLHAGRNTQTPYNVPWYIALGEPLSGKSSLLAASELELVPSALENNPGGDPRSSLPVRFWTGVKSVVIDISGKVFFDRWLEESSAEWSYIVQQISRKRRRRALDGVILTIPADALLADDEGLSSRKAILMANELGALLRQSGMRLPCYVVITKLDMVCGFQEYAKVFSGDQRHQILGFDSDSKFYNRDTFLTFWNLLIERLRSGAKQLLFPPPFTGDEDSRMDTAGKIWLFPDNLALLYKNLTIYLDILFGEENFHGTKNIYFEGAYFSSARDIGFAFSPAIATLAGRDTDGVLVPISNPRRSSAVQAVPETFSPETSTALMVVNATRSLINPKVQKAALLHGYFLRDLLHKRIFIPSPHAEPELIQVIKRNIPYYLLCALMIFLGGFWLFGPIFRTHDLQNSLRQSENYYDWLGSMFRSGGLSRSPLIQEDPVRGFSLNTNPVEGDYSSSRLQFLFNAQYYRDLKVRVPASFGLSGALIFRFDRNMGYRDKAFIANQLHKEMVRIPVIKNVGKKLIGNVDTQTLDKDTRSVIVSFTSLDSIQGVDFFRFFSGSQFKLDSMIRYLIPGISNDTVELLNSYRPRHDTARAPQMDLDYIYSEDYIYAKQAALDTMLSAWRRQDVYPDSIYGMLRSLVSISEDIILNFSEINDALFRIQHIPTPGVESAVFEWTELTDRHKDLAARGRALFEEIRIQIRAAGIPLGIESALPRLLTGGPPPDAFGDNLINNFVFNDLVIHYAVLEYTRLFESDMDFIMRQHRGSAGEIIAERNTFNFNLNAEVEQIHQRVSVLKNDAFFSSKIGDDIQDPSIFIVSERIITLASSMPLLQLDTGIGFRAEWEQRQNSIREVRNSFENYVGQYADYDTITSLIANASVMMQAEAFYIYHSVFSSFYSFLYTLAGNIMSVIESESIGGELFTFSSGGIEGVFSDFYFQRGYDPKIVKLIADDVSSFVTIITAGEGSENQPLFLQNIDREIYQPQAFMEFLANYFNYWKNYPENIYVSAGTWERFRTRSSRYRSFQINSVLLSVYTGSLEFVNQIDNVLLTPPVTAVKTDAATVLGDRLALLNNFFTQDAERMFAAWASLPADSLQSYRYLRALSDEDLQSPYLAVYVSPVNSAAALNIGWWNSFVLDGLGILAREANLINMNRLLNTMDQYRAWPLARDADRNIHVQNMEDLAALLEAMGVEYGTQVNPDPAAATLRQNLFQGTTARNWATMLHEISAAIADPQKPLAWTLFQAPVDVQHQLTGRGRLLAINRFRNIGVSTGMSSSRMSSTYTMEKLPLAQGDAYNEGLTIQFYLTSADRIPGATLAINRPWSIFELYLSGNFIADDQGNIYIPLFFEDALDRYVYYVSIEFNREIPPSSSWYFLRNWPDLIISGGTVTSRTRGGGSEEQQ